MPATSCPAYEIDEDIPVILMEEYGDRDYLQRKYEDARKRRISYRWSFTEVIEKLPIAPTPNKRPIPSFALDGGQYCFRPISAPKPASFAEAESAQSSQVWVANVFKADSCGPAVQQSQPERVILKILQPSMRPFPDDRGVRLGSPAHQLAYSEEILYKHMRPLQGSQIPYYFGTFLVTLPNGEDAYVLILEYIEGEVLEEWVTEYDTNETRAREVLLPVMIHSLIETFGAIHGAYVAHTDMHMNLTNINVRPDGTVVIIDFADCAILETPEDTERLVRTLACGSDNQGYYCAHRLLNYCLYNAGGPARARLEDWARTPGNIPAEVMYPDGPPRPVDSDQESDGDDSSFYKSDATDSDDAFYESDATASDVSLHESDATDSDED